ncbi:Telomere length regulator protein RIF1 [Spathaspora sp. JA1]|nr:Telomere length regulator protein RIF1 [Spathaspora sp. JA1]
MSTKLQKPIDLVCDIIEGVVSRISGDSDKNYIFEEVDDALFVEEANRIQTTLEEIQFEYKLIVDDDQEELSEEDKTKINEFNEGLDSKSRDFVISCSFQSIINKINGNYLEENNNDRSNFYNKLAVLLDFQIKIFTDFYPLTKSIFYNSLSQISKFLISRSTSEIEHFWSYLETREQLFQTKIFDRGSISDRISVLEICNFLTDRLVSKDSTGKRNSYKKDTFNDRFQYRVRAFVTNIFSFEDNTGLNKYFHVANRQVPELPSRNKFLEDMITVNKIFNDPYTYVKKVNAKELTAMADRMVGIYKYLISEELDYANNTVQIDQFQIPEPKSEAEQKYLTEKYSDLFYVPETYLISNFGYKDRLDHESQQKDDRDFLDKQFETSKTRLQYLVQLLFISTLLIELAPSTKGEFMSSIGAPANIKHLTDENMTETGTKPFWKIKRELMFSLKSIDSQFSFVLSHLLQGEKIWWGWLIYGKDPNTNKSYFFDKLLTQEELDNVQETNEKLFPYKSKKYFNSYVTPQLTRRMKVESGIGRLHGKTKFDSTFSKAKAEQLNDSIVECEDVSLRKEMLEERSILLWKCLRKERSTNWLKFGELLKPEMLETELKTNGEPAKDVESAKRALESEETSDPKRAVKMAPTPINKSPVASKTRSSASKKRMEQISPIRKNKSLKKKNKDHASPSNKRKEPSSTPIKIPVLHYNSRHISTELDSSPIKRNQDNSSPASTMMNSVSSSPTKKKKSVAFSDDLLSDLPVTPEKISTPKRSILKYYNINSYSSPVDPNNTALWGKNSEQKAYGPKNPSFWLQGTIVQLQPNSSELPHLIEGCLEVLSDDSFKRRFEVYATLNGISKSNSRDTLIKLFTNVPTSLTSPSKSAQTQNAVQDYNIIVKLSLQIRKDIERTEDQLFNSEIDKENVSPSKNDPFRIRIINQALKLINFFMSDQDFNNFLPLDHITWFYRHACTLLMHPKTSKAIVSPYLLMIKDCKFSAKKKRLVFDNTDIPENMLYSLINMKPFISASIVTEKFLCLKNFVLNFPNIMAKNVAHWFGFLIWNIFDVTSPFYFKCLGVGINCLLVVAKTFLDNKNISMFVCQFLSSAMPANFTSSEEQSETLESTNVKTIDVITKKLEELVLTRQYKHVMDLWLAITLLVGEGKTSFDKWEHLNKWLQIPKYCFNSQDENARLLVLGSWKAISFNICRNELSDMRRSLDPIFKIPDLKERHEASKMALKSNARLLTYLFGSFNASDVSNEVVDAMHNLFICILYLIINPQIMKQSTKYMHIYWDKIIQIVFLNFYFNKDSSTPHMNQLGLKILTRLLKPATPINEKNFNEVRCLSIDPVLLTEINSLPPRWVHTKFDRIMKAMLLVFQSENLYIEQKVNFFNSFLATIRSVTKNEVNVSPATYDIIDNIPRVLGILFESNKFSYDLTLKLVLNLHDTFDPSLLVNRTKFENGDISPNVYLILFQNSLPGLSNEESIELFSLIIQSLPSQKVLMFIADLCKLDLSEGIRNMFIELLNKRKVGTSEMEIGLYNEICGHFHSGFDIFVKKFIQSIVSLTDSDELNRCLSYIQFESWTVDIKMYFLLLVKGAPNTHVRAFTVSLLQSQLIDSNMVVPMIQFLTEQNFDKEIYALIPQIGKLIASIDESSQNLAIQALHNYLSVKVKDSEPFFALLDELILSCYINLSMDIEKYLTVDLSKLPLLSEELDKRGLTYTKGKLSKVDEDELVDPVLTNVPELLTEQEVSNSEAREIENDNDIQVHNKYVQQDQETRSDPERMELEENIEPMSHQIIEEPLSEEIVCTAMNDEFTKPTPAIESVNVIVEVPDSLVESVGCNSAHESGVYENGSTLNEEHVVEVPDSLKALVVPENQNILALGEANVIVCNPVKDISPELVTKDAEILNVSNESKPKKKEKTRKGKGKRKKSVKVKKEVLDSDSVCISESSFNESDSKSVSSKDPTFDIHTFTAVLNAQLTSETTVNTNDVRTINDPLESTRNSIEHILNPVVDSSGANSGNNSFSCNEPNSEENPTNIVESTSKRKHDEEYDNDMQKKRKLPEPSVEVDECPGTIEVVSSNNTEEKESGTMLDSEKIGEKVLFPVPSLVSAIVSSISVDTPPSVIETERNEERLVEDGDKGKDTLTHESSVITNSPKNDLVELESSNTTSKDTTNPEKECIDVSTIGPDQVVEEACISSIETVNNSITSSDKEGDPGLDITGSNSESMVESNSIFSIETISNDKEGDTRLDITGSISESMVESSSSKEITVQNKEVNVVSTLVEQLHCISDEEISALTSQEKYDMETHLLNLMLRLRTSR